MEPIPGFVNVPRLAGSTRSAGAFFSATVISPAGPGSWVVRLAGQTLTVKIAQDLAPGQHLRLKLVEQSPTRMSFQIVPPAHAGAFEAGHHGALATAFLAQGLPLVSERLAAWSQWLKRKGPADRENWAASLEARGVGPADSLADEIAPWLAWQERLEKGKSTPPPDEEVWDEWNQKPTKGRDPWLVVPLHWEYRGQRDAGLLQAHWNPQRQAIDQWRVTAAPGGLPLRVEAKMVPDGLDITLRLFRENDFTALQAWFKREGATLLSRPDLPVRFSLARVDHEAAAPQRGIDVQA